MIRKAVPADVPKAAAIYEAIFDREAETVSYTNWLRGSYPTFETAQKAIESGSFYVGEEDGELWGSVILNSVQLPEYAGIPWTLAAEPDKVAVIHTLCIHPAHGGRGHAREMALFCEETARAQGKTVMRLDTWEGNVPANRLYPSLGYRLAGAAEFFFQNFVRENLNCYEKAL